MITLDKTRLPYQNLLNIVLVAALVALAPVAFPGNLTRINTTVAAVAPASAAPLARAHRQAGAVPSRAGLAVPFHTVTTHGTA